MTRVERRGAVEIEVDTITAAQRRAKEWARRAVSARILGNPEEEDRCKAGVRRSGLAEKRARRRLDSLGPHEPIEFRSDLL